MLSAILLDLDGTIVDTDPLHYLAWSEIFREHGREIDELFYRESISGRFNPSILIEHFPHLSPEEIRRSVERKEDLFLELSSGLEPLPGLLSLMAWAQGLGVRLAVVSNAPAGNALRMLSAMGLSGFFSEVVLAEHAAAAKPDPAPYRLALERLQIDPGSALAFEDSPSGIQASVAAGIPTIGIASSHDAETLCAMGAMTAIRDFTADPLWLYLRSLEWRAG
ncbi:hydrolase [Sorangium cellulosum]|uniref:Hydrolase n=1 Tax=Sorangium cellulosum TaxID=56 RepID=A0A150T5W9_SORCE|nr:hydrolase [Sorangium cellulosum]KYG00143.1 hydrolase [Sorangium cellulosum]